MLTLTQPAADGRLDRIQDFLASTCTLYRLGYHTLRSWRLAEIIIQMMTILTAGPVIISKAPELT